VQGEGFITVTTGRSLEKTLMPGRGNTTQMPVAAVAAREGLREDDLKLLDELAKKHPNSGYQALVRLFKREHGREPEIDLKAVLGNFVEERPMDGQRSLYKLFKRQHGWAPSVKMFPMQPMDRRPRKVG
jgi:hypothetical protein